MSLIAAFAVSKGTQQQCKHLYGLNKWSKMTFKVMQVISLHNSPVYYKYSCVWRFVLQVQDLPTKVSLTHKCYDQYP